MGEMNNARFKFRGKAIVTGDWIYCTLFSPFVMDVIPETVGQCTGLKDKNGRLIYEGDIVFIHSGMTEGVIKFENGSFVFDWRFAKPLAIPILKDTDDVEITRNIHEADK